MIGEERSLDAGELKNISDTIRKTFMSSPLIQPLFEHATNKKIFFDIMPARQECVAMFTEYGSYNISTDVTGTETNLYQFRMLFQALSASDDIRVDAKEDLDNLIVWASELEEDDFPEVDDKRKIIKMNVVQTSTALSSDEEGYIIYHAYASAEYEKYN